MCDVWFFDVWVAMSSLAVPNSMPSRGRLKSPRTISPRESLTNLARESIVLLNFSEPPYIVLIMTVSGLLTCKLWRRQARGLEPASKGSCPWKSWIPRGPCRLGGKRGCWAWRRGLPISEGPEAGFRDVRSPSRGQKGGECQLCCWHIALISTNPKYF